MRELICVSRLTYRDSDEEEQVWSEEEEEGTRISQEIQKLDLSEDSGSSVSRSSSAGAEHGRRLLSPDSGFVTNGSPVDKPLPPPKENRSVTEVSVAGKSTSVGAVGLQTKSKTSKKKRKKKAFGPLLAQHELPKPRLLPPVQSQSDETMSPPPARTRGAQDVGTESGRGNFDAMLTYMDATIVADWLTRANSLLEDLCTFCSMGDNFVQFAHFWLSDFSDVQKQEIYEMEHEILVEEVTLAFAVGRESRKVIKRDILDLTAALFREYPSKLYSSKGSHLFLDYLDIITSVRSERYKKLLSDVRCSTRNRQYAQWLLATRSFAVVSMWSAVVNFYRNLLGRHGIPPGLPIPISGSDKNSVSQRRLNQSIRLGFQDVLHYLVSNGHADLTKSDTNGRSTLFAAIMHNQPQIVKYLATRIHPAIDVNQPSDTGNTALHAAANSGNLTILQVLCHCPNIDVNCCNPQCENATPLHLAVMHGNAKMVEVLLASGADPKLKMGSKSAIDIACDFDHHEILSLLQS